MRFITGFLSATNNLKHIDGSRRFPLIQPIEFRLSPALQTAILWIAGVSGISVCLRIGTAASMASYCTFSQIETISFRFHV